MNSETKKDFLAQFEEAAMAILLGFMTVLTFLQVVLRYVFNTGILWSLEATVYAFAALVVFGMSYGVRTQSHIAVDLVVSRLPPRAHHVAAILAVAFCLLYCGMMLYGSIVFVDRLAALGNDARDIALPKWVLTAVMPLGFALLTYRFLVAGWHVIRGTDKDMEFHEHGEHDNLLPPDNNDDEEPRS